MWRGGGSGVGGGLGRRLERIRQGWILEDEEGKATLKKWEEEPQRCGRT